MKLIDEHKLYRSKEYTCDLTRELDKLSKVSDYHCDFFYHYILYNEDFYRKYNCYALRVPGGTVGSIYVDDNNIITKIVIDTNYVIKTYPENINEEVLKYVGQQLEFVEEEVYE